MQRGETETYIQYFSAAIPYLKNKEEVFGTLKSLLASASALRWMQEDKSGEEYKNHDTVAELISMLNEKIAQKQTRHDGEDADNERPQE